MVWNFSTLSETASSVTTAAPKRVMSVSTPLICVRPLRKGESLGYGLSYTAESDRLIGWAAIGYADGYRRNPSPEACMCVNGIRVPVIGRVAMQTTCLDLTDLPFTPAPGDSVYVLGGPGHAVSVGSASFSDPETIFRIVQELPAVCEEYGISDISEFRGSMQS